MISNGLFRSNVLLLETGRLRCEMGRNVRITLTILAMAVGVLFLDADRPVAQQISKPKPEKAIVMPEVIILSKLGKQGAVTFNHKRHNGGEYNAGGPILCTECHHTAQPATELVRLPPLKTAWPSDRTTTLTAELFAEDPKKAGVAACRDCHARAGAKPKLLDKMPVFNDGGTGTVTKLTTQIALHQACDVCHFQIGFRSAGTKAPKATNCASCHKALMKK